MKKYLLILASAFFCAMMLPTLTSCSSDDDIATTPDSGIEPDSGGTPTELADVTIMYYAHGGGNLDINYIGNMRAMYKAEASCYKNVKIAIEYKFSTAKNLTELTTETTKTGTNEPVDNGANNAGTEVTDINYLKQMYAKGSRTFRFVLDPTKTLKEQAEENYLPGENADITNPDSLTNFINWAAKACPAKKYVLILNDHGGGYTPNAEIFNSSAASTRGVIYDDGYEGKHFSAPSLSHAIKSANIRPEVIYFDACLMNSLEYMFELKDVTDYIVASTYTTLAGAPYATLINIMSEASGQMRYALSKYTEYYVKSFDYEDDTTVNYYDMTTTETAKLDQLGKSMREFTDRLCNTYQNGTIEQKEKIDNVTLNAVKVAERSPLYDVGRYMEGMRKALPEVFDDAFWAELEGSFNNCIVGQYTSKYLLKRDYQVDYSVLLANEGTYTEATWKAPTLESDSTRTLIGLVYYEPNGKYTACNVENGFFKKDYIPAYIVKPFQNGQWGGTLQSVYGALAFDKATGWSRWLLLNKQELPLWCNNDFLTPLPIVSEE